MDEFAMGSSTENSAYFLTRNPWDLERFRRVIGGSAAAVAAGMAPASIGTDTVRLDPPTRRPVRPRRH